MTGTHSGPYKENSGGSKKEVLKRESVESRESPEVVMVAFHYSYTKCSISTVLRTHAASRASASVIADLLTGENKCNMVAIGSFQTCY